MKSITDALAEIRAARASQPTATEMNDERRAQLKDEIIELLAHNYSVMEVARELNMKYDLIYLWKTQDKEFAERMLAAREAVTDTLEKSMLERATNGTERYVIQNGRVVMDPADQSKALREREYDNGLTQFALKGRRRETYGDRLDSNSNINIRSDRANSELEAAISAAESALEAEARGAEAAQGEEGKS